MKPETFACSAGKRGAVLAARLCLGVAAAGLVGWAARYGISGQLVTGAALVGPALWMVTRPGWRTAWRVVVSDRDIEATGHGGTRRRLAWDGIGEVQHSVRRGRRGPIRVLRLLSLDRQRDILFDDRLPGFDRLVGLVERGIRHVGRDTPSSWRGMLWAGAGPVSGVFNSGQRSRGEGSRMDEISRGEEHDARSQPRPEKAHR